MVKTNNIGSFPPVTQRCLVKPSKDKLTAAFGELIYAHRTSLGLSQKEIAQAARISEGYFSEVENSKRKAPPRPTALRIARALQLSEQDEIRLVEIAAWERADLQNDLHLPSGIQQLITLLRIQGARMPTEVLDSIRKKLMEAYV